MLKELPFTLTPELYAMLYQMGHGDELVIADANFPAAACARRLYSAPDRDSEEILELVLHYLPLDTFKDDPAICMAVAPGDNYQPETWGVYEKMLYRWENLEISVKKIQREEFYERARNAYGIILTGERRRYGNIILRKGVVEPDD